MLNPFSLIGKTVLVTGASSGIGPGIAVACAGMGARVVLTARNKERLQETLSQMEGEEHILIPADLTLASERTALISQLPLLNGVVHCAGVMNRVPCKAIGQEDISSVFQPNLEAPMLLQAELLQDKKILRAKPGESKSIFFTANQKEPPVVPDSVLPLLVLHIPLPYPASEPNPPGSIPFPRS